MSQSYTLRNKPAMVVYCLLGLARARSTTAWSTIGDVVCGQPSGRFSRIDQDDGDEAWSFQGKSVLAGGRITARSFVEVGGDLGTSKTLCLVEQTTTEDGER